MSERNRRILVVDDDRENIDLITELLANEGHAISSAADATAALHRVKAWKPHLILLDINMPGMSGIELIPKIRASTLDDYSAIMLVSSNGAMEDVHLGLDAGADDYLIKPFRSQELNARVRALGKLKELQDSIRRAHQRIEELVITDDITGLLNLRALSRRAEDEILRCRRFRKPVCALLINLDRYASINEELGLQQASAVLREAGTVIRKCIRSMDLLGRVGADEFLIVLPETDFAGAEFVAERVRESIESAEIRADKQPVKVTACVGIAGFSADRSEGDLAELFRNGSEALRTAKANGPNRIEIYSFS